MRTPKATNLGEVITAAFDAAGRVTSNGQRASRLAARAVKRILLRAGRVDLARQLAADVH
jgi:hypothetical protein